MKAVAERLENNRVALQIEVEAEEVDAALERAYRKVAREVNIPGFRKGKAPRKLIEARFGPQVLYEEALDELVPKAYREALEATETEAIDEPNVSDIHIEAGSPLTFRAEVEVMPEAELGEYKGVKVEKEIEMVEESDIDHALWHLQEENAALVSVERTLVEEGDYVTIDFEGFLDGKPFRGGAAKGYSLRVGSGRLLEEFEKNLVGAEVGKETQFSVKFPDDYPNDTVRGKDVTFNVTVQSIKVRQVPELDDEFAADVSDAKSLAELRDQIRRELEESARERAEHEVRHKLVDALADASKVETPKVLVDREVESMLNDFFRRLYFLGINPETYLAQTQQTLDDLRGEVRPGAERRVKTGIVMQTLVKREGIAVSEEELQAKIDEIVADSPDAERVRKDFENPDRRAELRDSLAFEKAIDLLVANAVIEEKQVPSRGHGHHHHHDEDDDGDLELDDELDEVFGGEDGEDFDDLDDEEDEDDDEDDEVDGEDDDDEDDEDEED